MPQSSACPNLVQYQLLATGQMGEGESEAVLEHLENCDSCAAQLQALPEQVTLAGLVRNAETIEDQTAEKNIAQLVERLCKLRPQSAPVGNSQDAATLPPPATFAFPCPSCGQALKIKTELAGKKVRCPQCRQAVQAPANASIREDATVMHEPESAPDKSIYDFLAPAQAADELGRLGPYRVLRVLGAGGMGVVFRAEDPHLERPIALKAMLPTLAASESAKVRFMREARAAAKVKHDHIVTIHQVGEDRGVPFLAMEFLEGEPLDVRLERDGKLPVAEVLRIGRETALGLAAAHKRGLIHRDIKPANIWLEADDERGMINDERKATDQTAAEPASDVRLSSFIVPHSSFHRVKILDFGLARASDEDAKLTQQGAIVGTPAYMAPEQAQGKTIDQRCDLFSLGCVLYRMATGVTPFKGTDMVSTLMSVATESPAPPVSLNFELPTELSDFIMQLLAKNPEQRPGSAQLVAETLTRIAREDQPSSTTRDTGLSAAKSAPRRKWRIVAGVAACFLLTALVVFWSSGTFRLETKEGTIVLAGVPTGAEISVDGETAKIKYGPEGKWLEIQAAPGERKLEIKANGFKIKSQNVTFDIGEREPLRIHLEPLAAVVALPTRYKNTLGMEFALVPKGKAWLGGGGGKPGDKEVQFKHDFYLGVYEVTQEEWEKVTGQMPSHFSRTGPGKDTVKDIPDAELKRFPVEMVSWDDAQLFLERLNKREKETGWVYRLPKEAEWEYACRDGPLSDKLDSAFDFYFDKPTKTLLPEQANFENGKGLKRPCKVGSYKPNRLGLYDMHGNSYEWCDDVKKAANGTLLHGLPSGSWLTGSEGCRAESRFPAPPAHRSLNLGLRVARVPVLPPSKSEPASPTVAALDALRREQIPAEALKMAGDGDPKKAPASLVGVLGEARLIQNASINGLAFSPDVRWLASASHDKTIMLRDVSTGRVRRVLHGHTGPVSAVAFSKDGSTLVSASHDGTLKLWPVEKVSKPETLELKLGEVHAFAASPDGRFLAAGGTNGAIKLWKWGQWNTPVDLPALPGKVHALAFSPNGELLGSSEGQGPDSRVRLYQTSDGKVMRSWTAGKSPIHALAFYRDGKWLATTGGSTYVKLWDVASGKLVAETGEWTQWGALAFHPDGKTLYAFLPYTRGLLFDLPALKHSGTKGRNIFLEPPVASAAYSPDGKFLAFGTPNGDVVVWDYVKWEKQLPKEGHSHYVTGLAVGPDGRTVLSAGDENVLRQWDVGRPGESQLVQRFDRGLIDVAWSPDGKKFTTSALFTWYDDDQRGVVWDASTGKQLFKIEQPQLLHNAAFSPDSRLLAGCSHRIGCVKLWDANSGKELHRFPKSGVCLDRPAFSADGKLLAVATYDTKMVKVWNVASGAEVHSWEDVPMCAVALSPDSQYLAAGHFDGTISLWDLSAKDRKKRTLGGHSARVNVLKFTPDGKTLVSSSDDGTIRLWNHAQERALREIIAVGPAKKPLRFDLDPSGKYLFAAGNSPVIYVLRLPQVEVHVEPSADPDRRAAEWVLSIGGTIGIMENGKQRFIKAPGELPSEPIELAGVYLKYNQKVTDAGLAILRGCRNLTTLDLGYTTVGDAGVVNFKDCKKLTALYLPGRVTDAGLAYFKDCNLTTLSLHGLKVSNKGLANFRHCKNLTWLQLRSSDLRGGGLEHFKDCKDLTFLDLADTGMNPAELVHFKDCKNLTHLDLIGSQASDTELAYFKDCKNLNLLNLKNTKVSDKGLAPFLGCKNLKSLTLFKTPVSEASIQLFRKALPNCTIGWDGGVIHGNRFNNSLGMEFALVPKGKAWLGGSGGKPGTKEFELKEGFYLGVYEVTQEEWLKVMGKNPSHFSRNGGGKDAVKSLSEADLKRFPVENISWHDAQAFLEALNKRDKQEGWVYRLPTEAEWEYACRGGPMAEKAASAFDFYFRTPTNELQPAQANYAGNGLKRPCRVGSCPPNALGLHDMHGNVWEWCADEQRDPRNELHRVFRGGAWSADAASGNCRAVGRSAGPPVGRAEDRGLRVVRLRVTAQK